MYIYDVFFDMLKIWKNQHRLSYVKKHVENIDFVSQFHTTVVIWTSRVNRIKWETRRSYSIIPDTMEWTEVLKQQEWYDQMNFRSKLNTYNYKKIKYKFEMAW